MPRIWTNHLAESVWSEQGEHVWVRPRPIRQPRAGIQPVNGHTEAEPDPSMEHCKGHACTVLARFTRWRVPCSALCFWILQHEHRILYGRTHIGNYCNGPNLALMKRITMQYNVLFNCLIYPYPPRAISLKTMQFSSNFCSKFFYGNIFCTSFV